MTDLLQTAVATGTGKNAQIGRPVAGKTGTTQSNRDGWFLGFSSGLTTGVWMGRDDSKPVNDLQGGRAPALAFSSFMRAATANRPVEAFDTSVKMPEWQLETEQEAYFGEPDTGNPASGSMVDADGNPLGSTVKPDPTLEDKGGDPPPFDQKFIEDAIKPDEAEPLPNQ
jgi:penicillin-binding protein 1A